MTLRKFCTHFTLHFTDLTNFHRSQLRLARKKRWNVQEEKRISQEIELQSYLNQLIRDDMENRISKLSLDDTLDDQGKKDSTADIEQQCVSL